MKVIQSTVIRNVALYVRVSDAKQLRFEGSLDTQERALRSYVRLRQQTLTTEDWHVLSVFREEGKSAKEGVHRPELGRLVWFRGRASPGFGHRWWSCHCRQALFQPRQLPMHLPDADNGLGQILAQGVFLGAGARPLGLLHRSRHNVFSPLLHDLQLEQKKRAGSDNYHRQAQQ